MVATCFAGGGVRLHSALTWPMEAPVLFHRALTARAVAVALASEPVGLLAAAPVEERRTRGRVHRARRITGRRRGRILREGRRRTDR